MVGVDELDSDQQQHDPEQVFAERAADVVGLDQALQRFRIAGDVQRVGLEKVFQRRFRERGEVGFLAGHVHRQGRADVGHLVNAGLVDVLRPQLRFAFHHGAADRDAAGVRAEQHGFAVGAGDDAVQLERSGAPDIRRGDPDPGAVLNDLGEERQEKR